MSDNLPSRDGQFLRMARTNSGVRYRSIASELKAAAGIETHIVRSNLTYALIDKHTIEAPAGATRKQLFVVAKAVALAQFHDHRPLDEATLEYRVTRRAMRLLRVHEVPVPRSAVDAARKTIRKKMRRLKRTKQCTRFDRSVREFARHDYWGYDD